jgi:dsRNA-specific ribonuclease
MGFGEEAEASKGKRVLNIDLVEFLFCDYPDRQTSHLSVRRA